MSRYQRADPKEVVRACKRKPTPTLAAVGIEFDITRERVRQILRNAGWVKPRCAPGERPIPPRVLEATAARRAAIAEAQFAAEAEKERRLKAIAKARAGGATWKEAGVIAGFQGQQPGTSAWQFYRRHAG